MNRIVLALIALLLVAAPALGLLLTGTLVGLGALLVLGIKYFYDAGIQPDQAMGAD